ncbi:hypothetical protein KAM621c_07450 [Citrobacter braakii]|uniref:Uncharacterized protein n=1 Tax=Citrobacter braakii TaxID=57706 RepID=A0AAD1L0W7_CITBR|nr:hypothetical protein KAM621c_07450 [Citrobacter braakii]
MGVLLSGHKKVRDTSGLCLKNRYIIYYIAIGDYAWTTILEKA